MYTLLYMDVADDCSIPTHERIRDVKTLRSRFHSEGLSFLTKTLPRLGKSLDASLATGVPLDSLRFSTKEHAPKLFGDMWKRILQPDGCVRSDAPASIIRGLRQLTYYFYKLEIACSGEEVLDTFISVDNSLPDLTELSWRDNTILERAAIIAAQIVGSLDPTNIVPRHGPGAVATGESAPDKSIFKRFYPQLNSSYPYDQYFFGSLQLAEDPMCIDRLEETNPRAKVVLVPKDSRGPRIISCEPLEIQYIQQGLSRLFTDRLMQHWFTRSFLNFKNQAINQRLALHASCGRPDLGTFDMKDASDRVSLALVRRVFKYTQLVSSLENTRSTSTVLPDGRLVELKKYAPMGSALCFPVEAFCFFCIIVAVRAQDANLPLHSSLKSLARLRPWVYGDDLIFPVKDYDRVNTTFKAVGLLFNASKCCTAPGFRESCGVDAFNGTNVTPLRCKELWSSSRSILPSYVVHSNNAYRAGYYRLSSYLQQEIERIHGPLPFVGADAPALGWVRDGSLVELNRHRKTRFCKRSHRAVALTYAPRPLKARGIDGLPDMFRNLSNSYRDEDGRYTLQRRISIIRCWRPIT